MIITAVRKIKPERGVWCGGTLKRLRRSSCGKVTFEQRPEGWEMELCRCSGYGGLRER